MDDSACFSAVAFDSAGRISAVTSPDYDGAARTAKYYRNICKYPSVRVVTPEQLDALIDKERERQLLGE